MSQYYVFTIQRPSNKNDAARPGGSSDARPSETGFVAFERRDKAYAKRTDGLCNEGECGFDHLHSEPRYAEYLCAASVFHNENLASGLSAVAPELNG